MCQSTPDVQKADIKSLEAVQCTFASDFSHRLYRFRYLKTDLDVDNDRPPKLIIIMLIGVRHGRVFQVLLNDVLGLPSIQLLGPLGKPRLTESPISLRASTPCNIAIASRDTM